MHLTAVPIVFILVPFITDNMANGQDNVSDIIIHQAETKDDIS